MLTLLRGQEIRADLFACEKLYEKGMIEPIVEQIAEWALSGYDVTLDYDEHPSHFERALYMSGFLVAQGCDINELMRNWQAKGTCIFEENIPSFFFSKGLFPYISQEGARDFHQAHFLWQEEFHVNTYKHWKKEKESVWRASNTGALSIQKADLLFDLLILLKHLEKLPGFTPYQDKALYHYNMLRELMYMGTAQSFREIDKEWAFKQAPGMWRADFLARRSLDPLPEKCYVLAGTVSEALKLFTKMPDWTIFKDTALYGYNVLRELCGLGAISAIEAIDKKWLEEKMAESFRQATEDRWVREGNDDALSQAVALKDDLKWYIPSTSDRQSAPAAQIKMVYLCAMLKDRLPELPEVTHFIQVSDDYLDLVEGLIEDYQREPTDTDSSFPSEDMLIDEHSF